MIALQTLLRISGSWHNDDVASQSVCLSVCPQQVKKELWVNTAFFHFLVCLTTETGKLRRVSTSCNILFEGSIEQVTGKWVDVMKAGLVQWLVDWLLAIMKTKSTAFAWCSAIRLMEPGIKWFNGRQTSTGHALPCGILIKHHVTRGRVQIIIYAQGVMRWVKVPLYSVILGGGDLDRALYNFKGWEGVKVGVT